MLIQFSVQNFSVFKDKATLVMAASNYDKKTLEQENVFEVPKFKLRLLKSAAVFGANASGKTKLMEAFLIFRNIVINSNEPSRTEKKNDVIPFRLNTQSKNEPTHFEAVFVQEDVLYRYGFEATTERITREWLYQTAKTKEVKIFERRGDDFTDHHSTLFPKGRLALKERAIRSNALWLTVARMLNDPIADQVFSWFQKVEFFAGQIVYFQNFESIRFINNPDLKKRFFDLFGAADLGIKDIRPRIGSIEGIGKNAQDEILKKIAETLQISDDIFKQFNTTHLVYNENKERVGEEQFTLESEESTGTLKYFGLVGEVLNVLDNGGVLFVDELESALHPNLVERIIELFNSDKNPKNAQIIFNSHNGNLINTHIFRRDQIWFTEKNRYGEAKLFSLIEFKGLRDGDLRVKYLMGRFGGVPYLDGFDDFNAKA